MIPPQSQRVLEFLSDPRSYAHRPETVRLVQTHASWVFLASPFVYKIKKPVKFGFLDFSTLELRRQDCEREVELNRRLAEDVYLGVEAVRDEGSALRFGGSGAVVEWVVVMREMAAEFFLSHLLREGRAGIAEMDRIAGTLERFYASQPPLAPPSAGAAAVQMRRNIQANLDYARQHTGHSLSAAAFDAIQRYTAEFECAHAELLQSRVAEGRMRDCHGDLHAEHIHLTPEAVRIYDCIEFNTEFRHIDVACDVAFLAMDLDFNGRTDLARHLVEQFSQRLRDEGLARLADYYKCYRACVRGKVESLHSCADGVAEDESGASLALARRYFRLALRYALVGSRPCVVVFMGRVASGKSTLAEALGRELGWEVLSSDRIRKRLAGVPPHRRGSAAERQMLYSREMTQRVYEEMRRQAVEAVGAGKGVIVDATFSSRAPRDAMRAAVADAGCDATWVEVLVDASTAAERLRSRESAPSVVSDARLEDQPKLDAAYEPPDEIPGDKRMAVSSDGEVEATLHRLMLSLAVRHARARGAA